MILHPDSLADRGCWISDDRVYAFISSAVHGITEIGYHGAQPASRNARVFVDPSGIVQFAMSGTNGSQSRIRFDEFDWSPGCITMRGSSVIGGIRLQVLGSGRKITIVITGVSDDVSSFHVQFNKGSMFTDVHGKRTWNITPGEAGWLNCSFRDQIMLDEWMKREGAYGTDFLIPEPLRRKIYRRHVRSGLATPGDVLPEFQNASLPIYDAVVHAQIGGEGYFLREDASSILFSAGVSDVTRTIPPFAFLFDGTVDIHVEEEHDRPEARSLRRHGQSQAIAVPAISLPGFARIEEFFQTVPGLVESCVVRDYGVPRATPGGYYWIWAWDAMVTGLVALRWGATDMAERTAAFVHAHRDNGCIPMRWTHSLEPLDTQPSGALETLLASLTYALERERQVTTLSGEVYSRMKMHLEEVAGKSDRRGLFPNVGFYPDLPLQFGRTEQSAVTMEVAAFYAFCRVCENSALQRGDEQTARAASRMISTVERSFCQVFWDPKKKFFVDAVDRKSGLRNMSYPLFSLLFLHHAPALRLIRTHLAQAAAFIAKHHFGPVGMRMLPAWDPNASSETVSGSWYPHWDAYAIKLLRRARRPLDILTWLRGVELTLEQLGYTPEYLLLTSSLAKGGAGWLRHGAASNLNCATGWYQAVMEGVYGLDFDPGGLSIIPLALPLGEVSINGVYHLGTCWDVKVNQAGRWLQEVRVDGEPQSGCLKILKPHHDGGRHEIELLYGESLPGPHFLEVANAEVLARASTGRAVDLTINALGNVDLSFSAPEDWVLTIDGRRVAAVSAEPNGLRSASLSLFGLHQARISRRP